ncbi:alpha-L-rhamnosidase-like protein [Mucilaginibacter yixingensis]|uniref:Alpha-L-rhamnosidase-like protein n=1 Tax=Mucilaginibacter yixingensis TaxID=1295612 RepID=A0A2T5JGA5_9SPHI|nr:glycosyl hydrolase [Mucilaginibacter yixingensis]PTR01449.1 alpha-L-rhamnosidase-like protein [Mucilaginibacter yixingensis]
MLKKLILGYALLLSAGCISFAQAQSPLSRGSFSTPPDTNKINAWWHWMSGYITKDGITKDLEAMNAQGIHSATILNIDRLKNLEGNPQVKFGSPEWYEMFRFAIAEAKRLGMTIGTSNCDGWSESGGPWLKPENSMKQYIWRKTFINGGRHVTVKLNEPVGLQNFYKDDRILAYQSAGANSFDLAHPSTKLNGVAIGDTVTDGSPVSVMECKPGTIIDLTFGKAFTAEKIEIATNRIRTSAAKDVAHFNLLAGNNENDLHQIAVIDVPVNNEVFSISIPRTTAAVYRLELPKDKPQPKTIEIGDVALLGKDEVGDYHPAIGHLLTKTVTSEGQRLQQFYEDVPGMPKAEPVGDVIDVTDKVQNGILKWKAPAGNWTILRFGFTTTGRTNHPASKEGEGLECDKMDTTALNLHYHSFPEKLIKEAGSDAGKTFEYFLVDSWECMLQNWTDNFEHEFEKRRGYSMIPYLPVLCGEVVKDVPSSEAFLHDYRSTIADLIGEYYFKHLADLCHRSGMKFYGEGIYGGVIYPPLDILKAYKYFDVPMTEFWARWNAVDTPYVYVPSGVMNHNLVSHAAFLYHKPVLGAESYTGLALYSDSPWDIKLYGDNVFAQGVNQVFLHSYVHQPNERKPGLTLGVYGLTFNRHNTWWPFAGSYFKEQARMQYLLQHSDATPQVLIYQGDEMPFDQFRPASNLLSEAITYNYCNWDILLNHLSVKDGKLWLDNQSSFVFLILPDEKLDLRTLERIAQLVEQGATVYGRKPQTTFTLKDKAVNDQKLTTLADSIFDKDYGKGHFYPLDALKSSGIVPDVQLKGIGQNGLLTLHKRAGTTEIYELTNTDNFKPVSFEAGFVVGDKTPSSWDAETGEVTNPGIYTQQSGTTWLPVTLRPKQSLFYVFEAGAGDKAHIQTIQDQAGHTLFPSADNQVVPMPSASINSAGQLTISNPKGGVYRMVTSQEKSIDISLRAAQRISLDTAADIKLESEPDVKVTDMKLHSFTDATDAAIKYYSGVARYTIDVDLPESFFGNGKIIQLKIPRFGAAAGITCNDRSVGDIWEPNFPLNITALVHPGKNTLVIRAVNPWRNRIIGDFVQPRGDKNVFTTSTLQAVNDPAAIPVIDKTSKLLSSGLSAPIEIISFDQIDLTNKL